MGRIDIYPAQAAQYTPGATQTKTTTYTVLTTDSVVLADATTAAFTVTLPAVANGRSVTVKKTDATTNAVTVAPASGTIDGAANDAIGNQYQARTYVSDGVNWFKV